MELILGQASQFMYCSKFTTLTEEVCRIQSHVRVVVVSCLSGIVHNLCSAIDTKGAIEKAMSMLGSALYDVVRHRQGSIRIFVAPCTPRNTPDFQNQSKFAIVRVQRLKQNNKTYLIDFCDFGFVHLQRCLGDFVKEIKQITILHWSTSYDVRSDGSTLTEASGKQYLEDLLSGIRQGLERRRSASTNSESSQSKPSGSSTPKQPVERVERARTQSMEEDMRYKTDVIE